jgi:hypothetical protein
MLKDKNSRQFLRNDSDLIKTNNKGIFKVMKDKQGMYIRRSLVGTPEQFEKSQTVQLQMDKYRYAIIERL